MFCCRHNNHDNQNNENNQNNYNNINHIKPNKDIITNKENHCKKNHGMIHMLLMTLCCALPILAILILPRLDIVNNSIGRYLPYLFFLLCPLSHLFMMGGMSKNKKQDNQ